MSCIGGPEAACCGPGFRSRSPSIVSEIRQMMHELCGAREEPTVSRRTTLLVLLVVAAVLGSVAYFALAIDVPSGVREIPVEIDLDR